MEYALEPLSVSMEKTSKNCVIKKSPHNLWGDFSFYKLDILSH